MRGAVKTMSEMTAFEAAQVRAGRWAYLAAAWGCSETAVRQTYGPLADAPATAVCVPAPQGQKADAQKSGAQESGAQKSGAPRVRKAVAASGQARVLSAWASLAADGLDRVVFWPRAWKLTAAESRMLSVLTGREIADMMALKAAIGAGEVIGAPDDFRTVMVAISRMRRKLAGHGVTISTVTGIGYRLSPAQRTRLAADYLKGLKHKEMAA